MQKLKKSCPRAAAILLSLMMVVVFVPTFAFAAAAPDITVYVTISNQGDLAAAKDGSVMAWKEVKVKDADANGEITFDEALVATHDAYYEGGAAAGYSPGSGMAQSLWGVKNGGSYLFFINDVGITTGVTGVPVSEGDFLTAAVLSDLTYYCDWYAGFDVKKRTVMPGDSVTLMLKGHLGMAWEESDLKDVPLSGFVVKDEQGTELGTTDANGEVSLQFDKEGTYVITAEGTVKEVTASGYGMPGAEVGEKYICCDYNMNYLYTDDDYGDGPYPVDKIKQMDMDDYFDLEEEEVAEINWVYANEYYNQNSCSYLVKTDAPIVAPASVITVAKDLSKAAVTVDNASYTGAALTPAVTVTLDGTTLTAGKDFSVEYKDNVNAGTGTATVTGQGDYYGTVSKSFTIAKAAQPMQVKATNKTLKVKKLKKAKKSYTALKVSNSKGAVSYKVTYKNKKSKKALKFKNGKVTVKKKTKKGTYKVTVQVTAQGDANYKAATISKTITVKVKK